MATLTNEQIEQKKQQLMKLANEGTQELAGADLEKVDGGLPIFDPSQFKF